MKEVIINAVTALFLIDGNRIFAAGRKHPYVTIRQMVCYYLREEHKWTYEKIGEFFNLNHATVMFGIKNFSGKLAVYKPSKEEYFKLKRYIESRDPLDKELLREFLDKNDMYLSLELKDYLSVKL